MSACKQSGITDVNSSSLYNSKEMAVNLALLKSWKTQAT